MFQLRTPKLPQSAKVIDFRKFSDPNTFIGKPKRDPPDDVFSRMLEYARGRERKEAVHYPRSQPSDHILDQQERASLERYRKREQEAIQQKRVRSRSPPGKQKQLAIEDASTEPVSSSVPTTISSNETQGTQPGSSSDAVPQPLTDRQRIQHKQIIFALLK